MTTPKLLAGFGSLLLLLGVGAHAQDAPAAPVIPKAPQPKDLAEAKAMAVTTYTKLVEATYADALAQAVQLQTDLKAFVAKPDVPNHINAKLSWVQARLPYLQTEAFRFYGGPIDGKDGPEGLLNAWPLDEAYIDYVRDAPTSGIINDPKTYPEITPELLISLNEKGGERNVATGYHAIEFLLWGQDLSATGRGKRTFVDYSAEQTKNAARRGQYLLACSDLIVRQLTALHAQWKPGAANFRASLEAAAPEAALQRILTGVGMLAGFELAGERIGVAYETMEQEEEQSCFSDTTHLDMLHNTAGMANVVAGAYVGLDGKIKVLGVGLAGLADQVSEARGKSLREAINGAIAAANDIKSPFDGEILETNPEGRKRVKALMDAQTKLGSEIAGLAEDLGVKISLSPASE